MSTAKNIQSFYAGLDILAVAYQQIKVPCGEGHHLEAVYYPAAAGSPSRLLIVLGGGYWLPPSRNSTSCLSRMRTSMGTLC